MTATISALALAERLGLHPPTSEQAAVIEAGLEPAVVIAGAGSGKTETMATRVVWLVANRLVTPDAVLGLTFTRKAAAELGQRIRRRLAQWRYAVERDGPDDEDYLALLRASEPTVLTYAAYAGRLVSEQAPRLGAEPDSRLLSQAVAWQLADAVVRRHARPLPADIGAPASVTDYVLDLDARFADHLVDVETVERFCVRLVSQLEALPGKGIPRSGPVGELVRSTRHRLALLPLVRAYGLAKRATGAVDFGDQMRVAAAAAQLAEVQQAERARYRVVLLDEYQDTGHAQVAMLRGLFGDGHAVTAVGDPFQSIYGWRGASAGNIGSFAAGFARAGGAAARSYPLATSFRNDRLILAAANEVAAPLRASALTVPLRPADRAGPGLLRIARTETVEDEARWLAEGVRAAWDRLPVGARTAAVLVRRRAQLPLLADALTAAGLPVEVVGLGGLLTTPEVIDVVATLRVLADHRSGTALMRLLTGARWRIGPRDLGALRDRAAWLVRGVGPHRDDHGSSDHGGNGARGGGDPDSGDRGGNELAGANSPMAETEREPLSLVEALDDLGPPDRYSGEGFRRLNALAHEVRRLRRRVPGPLTELLADVERTIGVDVEVTARADRAAVGRVHLDRFLDEAARFAAEADDATLRAFLVFLDAAEEEENGLRAGETVVEAERVQLLTVHGAKGLEWDVVAVPGLVAKVFPAAATGINWARTRHELPGPLRGDAAEIPTIDLEGAADLAEVRARLTAHHDAVLARHDDEERRLAYVAFTRAKSVLLASGYAWDTTQDARLPSPFLETLRQFAVPDVWFEPEPDAANPLTTEGRTALWPADPLGSPPGSSSPGRRADVEAGAALVRSASGGAQRTLPVDELCAQWAHDVDVLLAERARLRPGQFLDVALPRQLSVSQLVELQRDPAALAARIRRPLPMAPAPWARRGTALHAWLEQRWQAQALLDVDELPGAADEGADDTELAALRAAFERSEWATRTPAYVEVPFEMAVDGTVIRGRMDAVFGSDADGWLVVDWKTGARPTAAAARAAAVQLAAYRLAWARLRGIGDGELDRVGAAFHYVRSGQTVRPADLLDAAGLRELVLGAAPAEPTAPPRVPGTTAMPASAAGERTISSRP